MKQVYTLAALLFFFSIGYAQNIGIGTTAPTEKLQVAGNIKADTIKPAAFKLTPNAGDGKILTSDAQGNGTWQNKTSAAGSSGNVGYGVWGDCATNGNISGYQPVADTGKTSLDAFGGSVAVSGNFAIVGNQLEKVGANDQQGCANIFQYDGTKWVLVQRLTDTAGAAFDNFGFSVAMSGNYAIVGAPFDDIGANANQGSVSIYKYNGNSWELLTKTTSFLGLANDGFGSAVAISDSIFVVGAPHVNSYKGAAYFFRINNGVITIYQRVINSSAVGEEWFGNAVAVSGNFAIVGAENADTAKGAAFIYQFNGSSWSFIQKITDPERRRDENFGNSVSLSGNYAIIGESADIVNNLNFVGSAYIFEYKNNTWALMSKLSNPNDSTGHSFGIDVSVSGDYAIVGSSDYALRGSATIYRRIGPVWKKFQYVTDPGGNAGDLFGNRCGIDGTTKHFIISAPGDGSLHGQVVFGKIN